MRVGGLNHSQGHLAVFRRVHLIARIVQKAAGDLAVELVVLHEQDVAHRPPPAARARRLGGHIGRSLAEGDVHRESGALPRHAFHSKLAFHKIEHVAHDGEPESRALNA